MTQKNQYLDYDNYEVYPDGRVYSIRSKKFLKPFTLGRGKEYLAYKLCKPGRKERTIQAHRLVAFVHIPLVEGKSIINHKNGIKTDNRVENLEWCTHTENMNHAVANKFLVHKKGTEHCRASFTKKEVIKFCKLFEKGKKPIDIAECSSKLYHKITRIYRRDNWIDISKDYNWVIADNMYKQTSIEEVIYYCKLFENGVRPAEIVDSKKNTKMYGVLRDIYNRNTYTSISKDFKWDKIRLHRLSKDRKLNQVEYTQVSGNGEI